MNQHAKAASRVLSAGFYEIGRALSKGRVQIVPFLSAGEPLAFPFTRAEFWFQAFELADATKGELDEQALPIERVVFVKLWEEWPADDPDPSGVAPMNVERALLIDYESAEPAYRYRLVEFPAKLRLTVRDEFIAATAALAANARAQSGQEEPFPPFPEEDTEPDPVEVAERNAERIRDFAAGPNKPETKEEAYKRAGLVKPGDHVEQTPEGLIPCAKEDPGALEVAAVAPADGRKSIHEEAAELAANSEELAKALKIERTVPLQELGEYLAKLRDGMGRPAFSSNQISNALSALLDMRREEDPAKRWLVTEAGTVISKSEALRFSTREQAIAEKKRLSEMNPGRTYWISDLLAPLV